MIRQHTQQCTSKHSEEVSYLARFEILEEGSKSVHLLELKYTFKQSILVSNTFIFVYKKTLLGIFNLLNNYFRYSVIQICFQ